MIQVLMCPIYFRRYSTAAALLFGGNMGAPAGVTGRVQHAIFFTSQQCAFTFVRRHCFFLRLIDQGAQHTAAYASLLFPSCISLPGTGVLVQRKLPLHKKFDSKVHLIRRVLYRYIYEYKGSRKTLQTQIAHQYISLDLSVHRQGVLEYTASGSCDSGHHPPGPTTICSAPPR